MSTVYRVLVCLVAALVIGCQRPKTEPSPSGGVPSGGVPSGQVASGAVEVSKLRDGDIIFQESTSNQSAMVSALTQSRWTHVGVIFLEASGVLVLEAATPVRRTPIRAWIAKGRGQRYVIKRLRDSARLTPAVIAGLATVLFLNR